MTAQYEVKIKDGESRYDRPEVTLNELERPSAEANLAFAFLDRWGMAQGKEIGEDSAGRTKWGPADVEWVVDRAFVMARLAFERARQDGLLIAMPTLAELDAVHEETKAAKAAKKVAA